MLHDHHELPPQECEVCGIYKVYRNGLCWRCIHYEVNAPKTNQSPKENNVNRLSEDQAQ